ncbi:MAG: hypothetical protein ABI702_20525 [Burkholderiales bacterium]
MSSRRAAFGIASFREQGLAVDLGNWRGVFAAKGLSNANVDALRGAVQKATQFASWKEALASNNWQPAWLAGPELKQALETDQSMASALVHMLHLKAS